MKKILALITSLSMSLSLLTALSPAFVCEGDAVGAALWETVELMRAEPEEEDNSYSGIDDIA